MLKTIIPESIWAQHRCLIVHPGPRGDRGPSSLDWAIELGAARVGRHGARGDGEVDGGDVWATRTFRRARRARAACTATRSAAPRSRPSSRRSTRIADGGAAPEPLDHGDPRVTGRPRPLIRQADRAIDWSADPTATVVRRIRAAEGHPGVLDAIAGTRVPPLRRPPRGRAARRAGRDRRPARTARSAARPSTAPSGSRTSSAPGAFKLPADARARARRPRARRARGARAAARARAGGDTFREIAYEEHARRRLPALRLLQRRDEHRPVPAAARRLPLRARAATTRSSC